MRFIEDDDALTLHRLGDQLRDLGIQQVLVVVHDDVRKRDHVTREKVGAPALALAKLLELFERVYTRGEQRVGSLSLERLEVLAEFDARVADGRRRRRGRSRASPRMATRLFVLAATARPRRTWMFAGAGDAALLAAT